MQTGQLTSRALTQGYLARIASLNPLLHAVIETNPQAVAIAVHRDNERRAGRLRGPLHGIPVLLKDNIATADTMQTTAGSLALVNSRVPSDAPLVARLRAAVPSSWARRTSRSGRTSAASVPTMAGVRAALHALPLPVCQQPAGIERGFCGRAARQSVRGGGRHRDRRFDLGAGGPQLGVRAQAHRGPHRRPRCHSDRPQPGHGRADGTERDRRGADARCDGHRQPGLPWRPGARRTQRGADRRRLEVLLDPFWGTRTLSRGCRKCWRRCRASVPRWWTSRPIHRSCSSWTS